MTVQEIDITYLHSVKVIVVQISLNKCIYKWSMQKTLRFALKPVIWLSVLLYCWRSKKIKQCVRHYIAKITKYLDDWQVFSSITKKNLSGYLYVHDSTENNYLMFGSQAMECIINLKALHLHNGYFQFLLWSKRNNHYEDFPLVSQCINLWRAKYQGMGF